MKFYILTDNSVQWFCRIVALNGDKVVESHDVPLRISGTFLDSIFSRDLAFTNRQIQEMTWQGWSISHYEYRKLSRLVEIFPLYEEFLSLQTLE